MSLDPYLLVEDEIRSSLKQIEEKLYDDKLEGLVRDSGGGGTLKGLQNALESTELQINELHKAVKASFAAPEKFNLTAREVKEREKQIDDFKVMTTKYHDRITDLFEAERLSSRARQKFQSPGGVIPSYMNDEADREYENQQMLMRQQDEDLDHLGAAAKRVGQMGLQIGDEIEMQTNIIGELEEDVDTTKSRLTVARNMMNKVS